MNDKRKSPPITKGVTSKSMKSQWARNNKLMDENLIKGGKWLVGIDDYLKETKDSDSDQVIHIKKMLNMHTISVYANMYYTTEDVALERATKEDQLFSGLGSK